MKTILINTETREVREIEIEKGLKAIYEAMGVDMIEVATYLPNGDCIYVDEEGMFGLNAESVFFDVGAHQPFVGNGLVIGTGRNGNSASCKSTLEEIRKLVKFKTIQQVRAELA